MPMVGQRCRTNALWKERVRGPSQYLSSPRSFQDIDGREESSHRRVRIFKRKENTISSEMQNSKKNKKCNIYKEKEIYNQHPDLNRMRVSALTVAYDESAAACCVHGAGSFPKA